MNHNKKKSARERKLCNCDEPDRCSRRPLNGRDKDARSSVIKLGVINQTNTNVGDSLQQLRRSMGRSVFSAPHGRLQTEDRHFLCFSTSSMHRKCSQSHLVQSRMKQIVWLHKSVNRIERLFFSSLCGVLFALCLFDFFFSQSNENLIGKGHVRNLFASPNLHSMLLNRFSTLLLVFFVRYHLTDH